MARAYAKAAYQIAKENQEIKSWENFLEGLNKLIKIPEIKELINHPQVTKQDLEIIVQKSLGLDFLNNLKPSADQNNFLKILISDHVLNLSTEIFSYFKYFLAQDLGICEATLESAVGLSPEKIESLRQDLSRKYQQEFKLNLEIKPELIGGFKIRTDHFVIDNSLQTRLKQLEKSLSQASEINIKN